MKKIITTILLVTVVFTLVACSSIANTNVRVLSLSYGKEAPDLVSSNQSIKLLSLNELNTITPEYVFPGDILTFTIELEDPNYEFISLLSIKINDKVIRANVSNAIFSTRDCGANICIDFPFEIDKDVSIYTIQEVKFAKLNNDLGVDAIIDRNSENKVTLDIYKEEVFPFVAEAVELLNQMVSNLSFYNAEEMEINPTQWQLLVNQRQLYSGFVILNSQSFYSEESNFGVMVRDWSHFDSFSVPNCQYCETLEAIRIYFQVGFTNAATNQDIEFPSSPVIEFLLLDVKYKDTYFFSEGNKIHVNILGQDHFLIEFYNDMKLKPIAEYFE